MWISIVFLLTLLRATANIHPTTDEISRGVAFKPPASWGINLRNQKNIRLLTLGGSNTAGNIFRESQGFVPYLNEYLKANVSEKSYIINEGRSGCTPDCFTGKEFDFEALPFKEWPNVVLLEFCVNLNQPDWYPAKELDKLVRSLNYKWRSRDLPLPEYIILELNAFWYIFPGGHSGKRFRMENPNMTKAVLNRLGDSLSYGKHPLAGFNRGCQSCAAIEQFARFYSYPLISWQDAAFPAFLRYLTSERYNSSVKYLDWPYMWDPAHLSLHGWHFFIQRIIGPFFVEQMQPRSGGEVVPASIYSHVYPFDLHMFNPSPIPLEIAIWSTSWGATKPSKSELPLKGIIHSPEAHTRLHSGWAMQTAPHRLARFPHDVGHVCYGSSNATDTATFLLRAPDACNKDCSLIVSTLRSWNASYVGNLKCSLWKTDAADQLVANIEIAGHLRDGKQMSMTVPGRSVVASSLTAGSHRLTCKKTDGLFTCIDSIIISKTLIL